MVLLLLESKAALEHNGVGGLLCHECAFLSLPYVDLQKFLTWLLKHNSLDFVSY